MSPNITEFKKLLIPASRRLGMWKVFRDVMAMFAIAYANPFDKKKFDVREAQYMQIIKPYTKEELQDFAKGIAHLVAAFEAGTADHLGELFMSLDLGNEWHGQFFTPYSICQLMAQTTITPQAAQEVISSQGFFQVSDPCIGAGALILALADSMRYAGINYQEYMHVTAVDVDITAVHMAYIQFTMMHIPAVIVHGNALTMEEYDHWYTPAHILGGWSHKLAKRIRANEELEIVKNALALEMPSTPQIETPAQTILAATKPKSLPTQFQLF